MVFTTIDCGAKPKVPVVKVRFILIFRGVPDTNKRNKNTKCFTLLQHKTFFYPILASENYNYNRTNIKETAKLLVMNRIINYINITGYLEKTNQLLIYARKK